MQQQMADMTTELQTVKQAMGSSTPSAGPSNFELQGQINRAKNDMDRALLDFNTKLVN